MRHTDRSTFWSITPGSDSWDRYQKRGASPDVVGADIVKAIVRGTDVLLTGPAARLFYVLRRISLRLARKLSYASARQVGLSLNAAS